MKNINPIPYGVLKAFEKEINGDVQTDNHKLDECCPPNQSTCYGIVFEEADQDKIFLIHVTGFINLTSSDSFKLIDVNSSAGEVPRVKYWVDRGIDLSANANWAPVFVSAKLESPLIAIDGNHRLMAHFLTHRSIEGIRAYLYVHSNISQWGLNPRRTI